MALRELIWDLTFSGNANDVLRMDRAVDDLRDNASDATREFNNVNRSIGELGNQATAFGKNMTAKVTLPLLATAALSTKAFGDYAESIAKLSTISDESVVPISQLSDEILGLSKDTGIAATALADDAYNAISASVDTADAVAFIAKSSKLSKAGFATSAESLDLLTTTLNAYKLGLEDVDRISDVFIGTQNAGKVTVGELSRTMGKAIPTAKAYGVDILQLSTATAVLTKNGIGAAEATTYNNALLLELGKSGTKASKMLQETTGKTFKQLIESGESIGDVLATLEKSSAESGVAFADMFGSAEAGKAALTLVSNSGKDFNDVLNDIEGSLGATDAAFKKVSDSPLEKWRISTNKMKVAMIKFGSAISPIVESLADFIGGVGDALSEMSPTQVKIVVGFGVALAAIGPILTVVGSAMSAYALITTSTLLPAIWGAVTATGAFTLALLANPFTWVVLGIASIAVAGWKLIQNWDKVSAFLTDSWDTLKLNFGFMMSAIGNAIDKFKPKEKFEKAMGAVSGYMNDVSDTLPKTGIKMVDDLITAFVAFNPVVLIINAMTKVFDYFKSINLFDVGKDIVAGLGKGMLSGINDLKNTASDIAGNVIGGFKETFDINSPSKVLEKIGVYNIQGLTNGMESEQKEVKKTAENTSNAMIAPIANTSTSSTFAPSVNIVVQAGKDAKETVTLLKSEFEKLMSQYNRRNALKGV